MYKGTFFIRCLKSFQDPTILGGQGIMSDVVGILPGPQPGFTRWLFDVVFRVYGTGTAPTVFLGQAYADLVY
jgi:hypothetical protein